MAGGGMRNAEWESVLCGEGVATRLLIVDVDVGEDVVRPSAGSKRMCVGVKVSYGIIMLDSSNADPVVEEPTFFLCRKPEPSPRLTST